jgi:hypothetical protein
VLVIDSLIAISVLQNDTIAVCQMNRASFANTGVSKKIKVIVILTDHHKYYQRSDDFNNFNLSCAGFLIARYVAFECLLVLQLNDRNVLFLMPFDQGFI